MAIKYLVLAFLAIQAINAGVIKERSAESDFQDLHAEILEHADKCSYLTKAVELAYERSTADVIRVAYMIGMASHTLFDQAEHNIVGEAPWAEKCFDNVHDLTDEINQGLLANTNECINTEESSFTEHHNNTIEFQQYVKLAADKMELDWGKCNDSECQDAVLESGKATLGEIYGAYAYLNYNIITYLQGDFKDMKKCAQYAHEPTYNDQLMEIVNNVQECILTGP